MVTYHEVSEEYFDGMAKLISDQWATPSIRDNPVAMKHSGLLSVYYFMVHHTFTCVAEDNGKVIGLIICTDIRERPVDMKYVRLLINEVAYMICNPETRDDGLAWGDYTRVARELEDRVVHDIDAEAELFVVDPAYRGQGIGKKLFRSMVEYYKKAGIDSFFLHTDTACSYPFYDRMGMTRIGEQKSGIPSGDVEAIDMFIYAAHVDDIK